MARAHSIVGTVHITSVVVVVVGVVPTGSFLAAGVDTADGVDTTDGVDTADGMEGVDMVRKVESRERKIGLRKGKRNMFNQERDRKSGTGVKLDVIK